MNWRYILCFLSFGLYVAAANCIDGQKLNLEDFKFIEHSNGNFNGLASTMKSHVVSLTNVIDDGNHKLTKPGTWKWAKVKNAIQWESKEGFDDFKTDKWIPQGISSTADAYDNGNWNGKEAFIVSWHNKDDSSVRVTFINKSNNSYRHVLLVYPTADDDFGPVNIHAGGIAWYGDKLYVVDTNIGIRVFDLNSIWKVEPGDKIGKENDKYTGANYKYVLPQISYYKLGTKPAFRFSYVALDRTSSPDSLLVGEYQTAGSGKQTRFLKWDLNYNTRKLKSLTATFGYCIGKPRMQGAVAVKNKVYISVSNLKDPGDLYIWSPGSKPVKNAKFFPPSCEDLSYNKNGNEIYGLTEASGLRYVLTYEV